MFTLDEAYKSLEGRTEFAVKEYRERLVSINYLITLPDSFDGIRKNFRGVTFDKKSSQQYHERRDNLIHSRLPRSSPIYKKKECVGGRSRRKEREKQASSFAMASQRLPELKLISFHHIPPAER